MLVFDAITGNNDRHFYNWGVIDKMKKGKILPKFAPIYDSSRGFLWNFSDQNVINHLSIHKNGGKKVVHYIENSCPRISIEGDSAVNHFDLVKFLKEDNIKYKEIILHLASEKNENKIERLLKKEFSPFFIPERSELLKLIIKTRFKRIREV